MKDNKKNLLARRMSTAYGKEFLGQGEVKNDKQKALVRSLWEAMASRAGRARARTILAEEIHAPGMRGEAARAAIKHIEYLDLIGACGSA